VVWTVVAAVVGALLLMGIAFAGGFGLGFLAGRTSDGPGWGDGWNHMDDRDDMWGPWGDEDGGDGFMDRDRDRTPDLDRGDGS
jgi:hypothetical protein